MRVAYRQLASVWREETFPSGHVVFHGFLALAENLSCSSGQRCARAVSCPCQRAILLNLVLTTTSLVDIHKSICSSDECAFL